MSERLFYLPAAGGSALALFRPAETPVCTAGALLLQPFGIEGLSAYRPLRDWAVDLAERGHGVLRLDLPGFGDGAPVANTLDTWEAWHAASTMAARWLANELGEVPLTAIGIGLGGLLAYTTAADGLVDRLVLWATPPSGRQALRELRAFARLEVAKIVADGAPPGPPASDETLAPGGFALDPAATEAIGAVDPAAHPVPAGTRALLLGRDGIPPSPELVGGLERHGAVVTTAAGNGYGAMQGDPAETRAPRETFELVGAWLHDRDVPPPRSVIPAAVATADELALSSGFERVAEIERPLGRLVGITTSPDEKRAAAPALVFLNAGAVRRIGPHGMWVDAARRWASRGLASLRLDVEGIGDADGDASVYADVGRFYAPRFVSDVRAALDSLEPEAGAVVIGLCSGGYWGFQTALEDERVRGVVLLNPRVLYWDTELEVARASRSASLLTGRRTWARLIHGDLKMGHVASRLIAEPGRRARLRRMVGVASARSRLIESAFDAVQRNDQHLYFVFCDGEPLHDELASGGFLSQPERWPNVHVSLIPGRDHTLRPLWMHAHADAALDAAIEHQLALAGSR